MRWKRIILFVVLGFISTGVAAFPFGFITGFLQARGQEVPFLVPLGQALAVPAAATIVFGVLAFVQRERVAAHVFLTAFLLWALSFVPNVLLLGRPFVQWALGVILMMIVATVGLGAGNLVRMIVGQAKSEAG